MCSSSSPTRPGSTAARSRSAASPPPSSSRAHGSPLVVYDEATLRARARAYREAAPRRRGRLRDEGVPERRADADPRRGGDRRRRLDARRAPVRAGGRDRRRATSSCTATTSRDEELEAAAEAGALVVVDSLEEIDRAREAGVARTLDPRHARDRGRHARGDPHRPPRLEVRAHARRRARGAPPRTRRPRASTCTSARSSATSARRATAVDWIAAFAARARAELGWTLRTLDLGGGLGVAATPDEPEVPIAEFVGAPARRARARLRAGGPRRCRRLILEPGRSLTARAGVTLYTVGSVKRSARLDRLRRRRRRHVRQPPPRPLRRPLHGRSSPTAPTSRRPAPTRSSASTASPATC